MFEKYFTTGEIPTFYTKFLQKFNCFDKMREFSSSKRFRKYFS